MVINSQVITTKFLENYNLLVALLPDKFKIIPPLFLIAIMIAIYAIFVWFFYRLLARRDVIQLNLAKYNQYKDAFKVKLAAIILYIIEFLIVSPIVIFLWFAVLSIFLIVLAKEMDVGVVILISAALIAAIRMTAYFNEDLSKDLAKMFPFTLLGVIILTPGFINIDTGISRIMQVPQFFDNVLYYFLFIVVLELLMRFLYIPVAFVNSKDEP
jgi:hypothetical protein